MSNANAAAAAAARGHILFESEREVVASVEDLIKKLPASTAQAKRDLAALKSLTKRINENLVKRGAGTVNNAVANQVLVNRAHLIEIRIMGHLALLREIVEACEDDAALFMLEYINAVAGLNGGLNFQ
ncbi:hypothetical protein OROMI_030404 [Orobanche minor]